MTRVAVAFDLTPNIIYRTSVVGAKTFRMQAGLIFSFICWQLFVDVWMLNSNRVLGSQTNIIHIQSCIYIHIYMRVHLHVNI